MNEQNESYKRQHKNALLTLQKLQKVKDEIDFKLKSNPICTHLHKDLRSINLDIKITVNEIEHIESYINEFEM
ncbi:hypothetical protein [Flavobacterium sp. N3904]|uniref:hypothetical protein n=1 Tax=Flavobacterium sp. N3904 TaxID=2986835 RepID=UPI002224BC37|nr:hypothetical protein [Flavobacterium sp. N3904]